MRRAASCTCSRRRASLRTELRREHRRAQNLLDRGRQRRWIVGVREESGDAILDRLWHSAFASRHDRKRRRRGLHERNPEALDVIHRDSRRAQIQVGYIVQ